MKDKVQRIVITFPVPVDPARYLPILDELVYSICRENTPTDCTMWPSAHGFQVTQMPMTQEEEAAGVETKFDESTYHIGVSIKEKRKHMPPRDTRKEKWPEDDRSL